MDTRRFASAARVGGLAAITLTAGLVIGGATWHGMSAQTAVPQTRVATAQAPGLSGAALGGRTSYADVVKAVTPAVVTIRTEGKARISPTGFGEDDELFRRFFGPDATPGQRRQAPRAFRQHGLGSGVVVTSDGYILTNNHVIDGADEIHVEFANGKDVTGKVIGADKLSDLAVVKVEESGLQSLPLGDSDAVQVGDVVLAIGNPLGIGQTVTMGIISAKGRSTPSGDGSYEDFLQTDAPINHGNSGGALVNLKGELVGINSQIVSQSDGNIGIGFAIPTNMAKHVMTDLRNGGRVRRSQLGVNIQPVTSDLAESLGLKDAGGAIVSSVKPDSAADRAGVKRNDVIKSLNGQPVQDINALRNRIADTAPGSTVNIGIVRDGRERTLSVKLDELQPEPSARAGDASPNDDGSRLGISVSPLTADLAAEAELPRSTKGLVIEDVNPDGRAANAGLREGDIILEVNQQTVTSPDELRSALRRNGSKPALLLVRRDGAAHFLTIR